MAVIRCKICGGDLNVVDGTTVAVCEYCGTRQTLPKINDEQRAAAFNRGDHFRKISEFDKALSVYERIIAEDDTDAEAHWCAALSRYGIEYVKDPASGKYIPTCHRASYTNFLDDVDYQAAVANADPVAREQYEQDGQIIAEVQRNIIETVNKEAPFDVFICYKESDDRGQRTLDSTLAQDIYYRLTDQGYRVFFSRITLEDKAGQQYEPYIFAALHSAKVMIVIGTRPEYMNAVWVKNEWSRYLALMKNDRSRLLIPCYRDMDPYDMPEQLSVLQSYDMSRIGFIQDLIRGISKVLEAEKPKEKETIVVQASSGNTSLDAQIKRGNISLEDGDFKAADNSFDRALDMDPECAEAYLGKALAEYQCRNLDDFIAAHTNTNGRRTKQTISIQRGNDAAIDQSVQKYYIPNYSEANAIRNLYRRDLYSFQSENKSLYDILQAEYQYLEHDKYFSRAFKCANDELKSKLSDVKNTILINLQNRLDQSKTADDSQYRRILDIYAQEFQKSTVNANQQWQTAMQKRESDYQNACSAITNVNTVDDCDQIISRFRYIGLDYKDVSSKINGLEQNKVKIHQETIRQQNEKERKLHKAKMIKISAIIAVIAIVVAVLTLYKFVIQPSREYKEAERLLAVGEYDKSISLFKNLNGYKDSFERVAQVYIIKGESLLLLNDYDEAIKAFENADESEKIKEAYYQKGLDLLAQQQFNDAYDAFAHADGYLDASERKKQIQEGVMINEISAGRIHTVGLRTEGTVIAAGSNTFGQCNVSEWRDVIAVSAGGQYTVGLKSNGTVIAVGNNEYGQCDVSEWRDIIAVAAGDYHTVGLKTDSTVVAVGSNEYGQCNVSDWKDIIAVSAGDRHTIGLKSDGTVVAVGEKKDNQCNISDWQNITAISAGSSNTVGLKSDGTVLCVGSNVFDQCNISDWKDIIAISSGTTHTVGLKSDGTVIVVGSNNHGQCNVSDWKNVIAVAAGSFYTIGLKSDGTVVAVGNTGLWDQLDVSGWNIHIE